MANTHSLSLEKDNSQYAYVTDKAVHSITGDLTIEAWVRMESLSGSGNETFAFVSKWGETGQFSYEFYLADNSGNQQLTLQVSSAGTVATQAGPTWVYSLNTWYHIAVTYDASAGTATFYINGSVEGSPIGGLATSIFNGTSNLAIGGGSTGSRRFHDGLIDDVRLWNDIRTAEEISANYRREVEVDAANLVGYWKFNNDYTDATSNNNTLTASGSPVFSTNIPFGYGGAFLFNVI